MVSPSSNLKPMLNEQDYMELVLENGKIVAKGGRANKTGSIQKQRTKPIWELYESEYDEGFKKHIKKPEDLQVVPAVVSKPQQEQDTKRNKRVETSIEIPDEESVAGGGGRSKESSMFSIGSSTDLRSWSVKRKNEELIKEEEEEEEDYLSDNSDDESDDAKVGVPQRKRRTNEFNQKMRDLKDLLPNYTKDDDKASLLDEAINYLRTLQFHMQLKMMSIGNGLIRPPLMFPMAMYMNAAAATTTPIPPFLPMNVQEPGFPWIYSASSQMLNFLNQYPTGLIPNDVPSCVPQAQDTSSTQFPNSL